jgi:hypothetical protein
MKRVLASVLVPAAVVLVAFVSQAQDKPGMHQSVVNQTAEWQKLKTLVGQWEGVMTSQGKQLPTKVEVRLTGDGSALMHVMDKDGPYEMVTMIHPDGKRILATHYCAAHNQPRMALVPSKGPNQVAFEFVDGSNIAPGDNHMKGVVFTFTDADHHEEAWTSTEGPAPAIFKYARKK